MSTEKIAAMWTMCQITGWPLGTRTEIIRDPILWAKMIARARAWQDQMRDTKPAYEPHIQAIMEDEVDMVQDCIDILEGE